MSDALTAMNQALERLAAANCRREGGKWVDRDGAELASDPIGAARELRRLMIKTAVETARVSGTGMHR